MIIEYNRPETLEQALALLARATPRTLPLAGGASLNQPSSDPIAVVDLQALGLNELSVQGQTLHLGATLTLQALLEAIEAGKLQGTGLLPGLQTAIEREAAYNLRQVASIAGTLVSAGGRSPFATALLALDAQLSVQPGGESLGLGDVLPLRSERLHQRLITRIVLPLNARLTIADVARTPADQPIVVAAVARWPSGRVRAALGGFGAAPTLAFDGSEADGLETAARSAYAAAGDEWASAEYRQEMAAVLVKRCLD